MIQYLLVTLLLLSPSFFSADEPAATAEETEVRAESAGKVDHREADQPQVEADESAINPRFELFIPSVDLLAKRTRESHAGALLSHMSGLFSAKAAGGSGLTEQDWQSLADMVGQWPDTSMGIATYAPTAEGKRRWSVRINWQVEDLRARVAKILAFPWAEEVLEGIAIAGEGDGCKLTLGDTTLAVMLPDEKGGCLILSDAEVPRSASFYGQDAKRSDPPKRTATLIYSRLNIAGTEKDSGALFGSQIPWVDNIRYQASVRGGGEWSERFGVTWNALVGAGAKSAIKRAKRGFYVPREAFGAALISSPMMQGMLDTMAGLEPGTLLGEVGSLTGDRVGPETCFVLLPGTGLLPFPDFVIQTRCRYGSAVLDDIRTAIAAKNKERTRDELSEIWHEIDVDGRTVFFYDARDKANRGMQPAVYRKALFVDERTDPDGRKRSYLNIAFTSTDVQKLVRSWTQPRAEDARAALAASEKSDARAWLNWKNVYDQLHVYLNMLIAGVDPQAVLPSTETVAEHLVDATVTVDAKFTGLMIRHRGPLPAGLLYVPLTMASTLAPDESGGSDLSRERIACDRLKLLHKNALLFKKDVGRWPARVAELDGYIDFAGHPWVLRLRRSTRTAWREGFQDILAGEDETEDEEETDIDDSIFVVKWDGTHWTLGLKPDTLEHLAKLYIDQDGNIHRVANVESTEESESGDDADESLM